MIRETTNVAAGNFQRTELGVSLNHARHHKRHKSSRGSKNIVRWQNVGTKK